jgi:hypothetical protein
MKPNEIRFEVNSTNPTPSLVRGCILQYREGTPRQGQLCLCHFIDGAWGLRRYFRYRDAYLFLTERGEDESDCYRPVLTALPVTGWRFDGREIEGLSEANRYGLPRHPTQRPIIERCKKFLARVYENAMRSRTTDYSRGACWEC